jgi:hypothetical protein
MPALVIRNKLRDPQHAPQHELRESRVVDRFDQDPVYGMTAI